MYSLLITFFLVAIVVSFLCSLWEAALLSVTPSYAQVKLREGSAIGKRLQAFKSNIDQPLAAILTLNTIAHTVGAVGVGDQAAKIWATADPLVTGIVVPVVMTLAILVLSELIPKTIGANFWRELAPFTVTSLSVIIFLLYPLVWLGQLLTRALKKDKSKSVFSRLDFLAMAELGARDGVFAEHESQIIRNLLKFNTVRSADIMTPRPVVQRAADHTTLQVLFDGDDELRFSRIPLYQADAHDQVTGYVLKHELFAHVAKGQGELPLSAIRRDIVVVPENYPITNLFNHFLERREHIAAVVDEFGGMSGIVTMEDVIETLLGLEIVDELDNAEDMRALARENWAARARTIGLVTEPVTRPQGEAAERTGD